MFSGIKLWVLIGSLAGVTIIGALVVNGVIKLPQRYMEYGGKVMTKVCKQEVSVMSKHMKKSGMKNLVDSNEQLVKKSNQCAIAHNKLRGQKVFRENKVLRKRFKRLCRSVDNMAFNDEKSKCVKYRGKK